MTKACKNCRWLYKKHCSNGESEKCIEIVSSDDSCDKWEVIQRTNDIKDGYVIDENKEVYKRALNVYGEENQVIMIFEEMSELQKTLTKHLRGICDKRAIADEIADVEIMLEQMKLLFNIENEVEERKQFKVERLMTRLDQKQNELNKHICKDGVCYLGADK